MSDDTSASAIALEFEDVCKTYAGGRGVVLDRVTFTVAAGEFVVLEGPSGSGKSTTINLAGALDRPDSGHIRVHGHELTRHRRHLDRYRREEIGVVFQLHNLLPHLSAQQNVEVVLLGGRLHRSQRHARARSLLTQVHLERQADVRPPELSGGERQRIAVARALANDPKLLLADEPTGSLDDDTAGAVIGLLRACCDAGGAVLAVSHDPRLTNAADRVLRLVDGHIALGA